jgi:mRNA interferase MazF
MKLKIFTPLKMESQSMIKHAIVLVPFPFDDHSGTKPRPALCLTHDIGKLQHIIIAFISSNLGHSILNSDILVLRDADVWEGSGLKVDSIIRLHKLVTIPKTFVKRKLGTINEKLREEVQQKLIALFNN